MSKITKLYSSFGQIAEELGCTEAIERIVEAFETENSSPKTHLLALAIVSSWYANFLAERCMENKLTVDDWPESVRLANRASNDLIDALTLMLDNK